MIHKQLRGALLPLVFLFLLISSLSVLAANPHTPTNNYLSEGLQISYPNTYYIKYNTTQAIRFWVYNVSDGEIMTNRSINCTYNLLDNNGLNIIRKATYTDIKFGNLTGTQNCQNCFNFLINSGNFSYMGYYSYQIRCQGSGLGGYLTDNYLSTDTGWQIDYSMADVNYSNFFILIGISVSLLILAYLFKNYISALLSGLMFLITGTYAMIYGFEKVTNTVGVIVYNTSVYTQMISVVIIGFGTIITIVSALEYLEELSGGDSSGGSFNSDEDDD
jgi:hypothetical protein